MHFLHTSTYICMLRVACLFIHVCTYTYMYMGIYPRSVTSFYSFCSKHQSDPLKQINYVMLYTCLPWWPLRKRYPLQSKGLQTRNLFCIKCVLSLSDYFFIMPYCFFKYNARCNTWCQINCFQVQVQVQTVVVGYIMTESNWGQYHVSRCISAAFSVRYHDQWYRSTWVQWDQDNTLLFIYSSKDIIMNTSKSRFGAVIFLIWRLETLV